MKYKGLARTPNRTREGRQTEQVWKPNRTGMDAKPNRVEPQIEQPWKPNRTGMDAKPNFDLIAPVSHRALNEQGRAPNRKKQHLVLYGVLAIRQEIMFLKSIYAQPNLWVISTIKKMASATYTSAKPILTAAACFLKKPVSCLLVVPK